LARSGELWLHLVITLQEVIAGFALGILIGMGIGFLFHWNQRIAKIFLPYIQFLYSTPYVILVPLLMFWFGIDIIFKVASVAIAVFSIDIIFKVASVAIAVFSIMAIQTYEGMRIVDRDLVNFLKSIQFTNYQIVKKVTFPSSLFFVFTGLRIAFGRAMVMAIVAEFQASREGIGYLIQYSSNTFNTSALIVGVIVISLISLFIIRFLSILEKYVIKWQPR